MADNIKRWVSQYLEDVRPPVDDPPAPLLSQCRKSIDVARLFLALEGFKLINTYNVGHLSPMAPYPLVYLGSPPLQPCRP